MPVAKYPRTPHLPYSPGAASGDRRWLDAAGLVGREVVVTEKLDGSGVCLAAEGLYARSRASGPTHPSFSALWPIYHQVRTSMEKLYQGASNLSVFGEWTYAVHSVWYPEMQPHRWLHLFGVRDETDGSWWSFDAVSSLAAQVEVCSVPVDARMVVASEDQLRETVEDTASRPSAFGPVREGVVVRVVDGFCREEFSTSVAKWVRADHVAGEHWSMSSPRRHDQWTPHPRALGGGL